jgi:hypothetical protein
VDMSACQACHLQVCRHDTCNQNRFRARQKRHIKCCQMHLVRVGASTSDRIAPPAGCRHTQACAAWTCQHVRHVIIHVWLLVVPAMQAGLPASRTIT